MFCTVKWYGPVCGFGEFLGRNIYSPQHFQFFLKSSFPMASVTPNLLVFCLFLLNLFHKPLCLSLCVGVFLGLCPRPSLFPSSRLFLANLSHPQDILCHLMISNNSFWAAGLSIPLISHWLALPGYPTVIFCPWVYNWAHYLPPSVLSLIIPIFGFQPKHLVPVFVIT